MIEFPSAPVFVPPLPRLSQGNDFLSLAAVNERLIATVFPGMNNVTPHMRVYSVMSWMAWRFGLYLSGVTPAISEAELRRRFKRFQEKVETLFVWGNAEERGIVGRNRRKNFPDDNRKIELAFETFGESGVSALDAAFYGPSLNDGGMAFVANAPADTLRPTQRGEGLALALDASLQRSSFYKQLADVEKNIGNRAMALDLAKRWTVQSSTDEERKAFREGFFQPNAPEGSSAANRASAIRLVIASIRAHGGKASEQQIRESIARGTTRRGKPVEVERTDKVQAMWAVLQVRQLQRLCLEGLLRWFEIVLNELPEGLSGKTAHEIAEFATGLATKSLRMQPHQPLSLLMNRITSRAEGEPDLYVAGLSNAQLDPFNIVAEILDLPTEDEVSQLPGACLYGLALSAVQTEGMATQERYAALLKTGRHYRISLADQARHFRNYADQPLSTFFSFLIDSYVIGQHFATVESRLEMDKNKYRFLPSDDGFRSLVPISKAQRLAVTPDHLRVALALMADSHLVRRTDAGNFFRFPTD